MPSLQYFDKLISNVIVFYIDSIENFLSDNNKKNFIIIFRSKNCGNLYPHNYNFHYCYPIINQNSLKTKYFIYNCTPKSKT